MRMAPIRPPLTPPTQEGKEGADSKMYCQLFFLYNLWRFAQNVLNLHPREKKRISRGKINHSVECSVFLKEYSICELNNIKRTNEHISRK